MINWMAVKKAAAPSFPYVGRMDDFVVELRAKTAGDPISAARNATEYVKSLQQTLAERAEDHRFDKYIPTEFAPITEDEARRIKSFQSLNNMPWRGWRNMALDSMYVPAFRYTTDEEGNFYLNNNRVVDMDGFQVYENGNRIFDNKNRLLTPNGDLALQADGRPEWDTSQYKKLSEYPDMFDFYNTYYKGSTGLLPRFGSWGPDLIKKIDPNGYLKKYGVVDPDDIEADYTSEIGALAKLRSLRAYTDYLKQNYPDDYQDYANGIGSLTDLEAPLGVDPAVAQQQKAARQAANAARRWGNSMINLTPQQYAYYNAKQNYNATPGDTRYNLMMQAKRPLKPVDLQNIKKYTVQQRMMNTPQPNGLPKTPQMLQREWQDENKRRQTVARDMYKNEVKGLKNRTGSNAVPTMIQPWGGR